MNSKKLFHSFLLHLADSSLILAQRNGEWCAHGPVLEQDIAITNITLDLIGQSRNFYQYVAKLMNENTGSTETEDSLAYLRGEREFKNLLLSELPKGDWAQTVLKQFFYSVFQQLVYEALINSDDEQVAAIAAKSLKEVHYHVKWSSEWVIRLGDGTEESHQRMKTALEYLWPYTGEIFMPASFDLLDLISIKDKWMNNVRLVFEEATLTVPDNVHMYSGGKNGIHTEHLGFMLSEMQYLQRAYPGAEW